MLCFSVCRVILLDYLFCCLVCNTDTSPLCSHLNKCYPDPYFTTAWVTVCTTKISFFDDTYVLYTLRKEGYLLSKSEQIHSDLFSSSTPVSFHSKSNFVTFVQGSFHSFLMFSFRSVFVSFYGISLFF